MKPPPRRAAQQPAPALPTRSVPRATPVVPQPASAAYSAPVWEPFLASALPPDRNRPPAPAGASEPPLAARQARRARVPRPRAPGRARATKRPWSSPTRRQTVPPHTPPAVVVSRMTPIMRVFTPRQNRGEQGPALSTPPACADKARLNAHEPAPRTPDSEPACNLAPHVVSASKTKHSPGRVDPVAAPQHAVAKAKLGHSW